jgi:hypothetical protein
MITTIEERPTETSPENHRVVRVSRRIAVGLGLAEIAAIHISTSPASSRRPRTSPGSTRRRHAGAPLVPV